MKKPKLFLLLLLITFVLPLGIFAQQNNDGPPKYALVIGNGNYTNVSRLANPVNDANDMTATLEYLGFTVEKILNGRLDQMEDAIMRLKNRLSSARNSYGFFFYAGHGVQSGGENYLLPVDANIPSESYLRQRAVSVQTMLDELNNASNELNIVVLDACRDNPFGWRRSGSRGLALINYQPADSIIVYATSAGSTAADGEGRNGLFTTHLLNNLTIPGLEISEVFRRTGADVAQYSGREQMPAIYNQFFGVAYLAGMPGNMPQQTAAAPSPMPLPGQPVAPGRESRARPANPANRLWSVGASVGTSFIEPWLVGTVRGTVSPFSHTFIELGLDVGLISGVPDAQYLSFGPFLHAAFFYPFTKAGGFYAGAGAGYINAKYTFDVEGTYPISTFTANVFAGILLFDMLDISYTFKTDFSNASNKFSVGYAYRFR